MKNKKSSLFLVCFGLLFFTSCLSLPKEIRYEKFQPNEKFVKLRILSAADLTQSGLPINIINSVIIDNSINLGGNWGTAILEEQKTMEEYNKVELRPYLKESIETSLFNNLISTLDSPDNGYLVYSIDRAYSYPDGSVFIGAYLHGFFLGVPTILGMPWGYHNYLFQITIGIYDLKGKEVKTYSDQLTYKQIRGLYYGYENYAYDVADNVINSLYKKISPDIRYINEYLLK